MQRRGRQPGFKPISVSKPYTQERTCTCIEELSNCESVYSPYCVLRIAFCVFRVLNDVFGLTLSGTTFSTVSGWVPQGPARCAPTKIQSASSTKKAFHADRSSFRSTQYAVRSTQYAVRIMQTQCAISNTGESGLASTQYAICMQDAILYAIGNSAKKIKK
jgi:hypothetical protein